MTSRAEDFRRDPAAGRWHGPDRDGCIQQHDEAPPVAPASALRDAAFITLVRGRSPYEGLVRDELVAQSRTNGVDFSNTDRWCGGVLLDVNPSFEVAQWLTKHLFAYDYLGPEVFTREERSQLDSWFRDAARFFQRDLDASLDRLFRNRASGDYRPVERLDKDPRCSSLPYYGGPSICSLARHYNNRHASIASFVGLVGVHQGDTSLQESASNFVKEFVMFGVFPEGFVGDFERWTGELPDLGWAYGNGTLGAAVTVADALARAGDTRLYEYETPEGAFGTQGGPKSLHFAIRSMGQYVDGTFERYATADPEKVGDPTYRINGSAPHRGWYGVHDVWYSQANRHYQDPYLRDMYTRGGHGMAPYPKSPAPGEWELWEGEGGVYPGVLFMFGQMEHIGS